jgi:hypothetical protein
MAAVRGQVRWTSQNKCAGDEPISLQPGAFSSPSDGNRVGLELMACRYRPGQSPGSTRLWRSVDRSRVVEVGLD